MATKRLPDEKSAIEMAKDHETWRDSQTMTFRCMHCRRFKFTGTRQEGISEYNRHQMEKHPDKIPAKRRKLTPAEQREIAMQRSQWRREQAAAAARGEL
jgi:hypothetical protein